MKRAIMTWVVAVALAAPALAAAAPSNPYDRELEVRRERFEREGGRPQALVPLLGLLDLWDRVSDRKPLADFLESAAKSGKARPDVRGRAGYLYSLVLDRLGRDKEAAQVRTGLGLITRFVVVGPFDNEGKAGHAMVFAPERALGKPFDRQATYDGKERRVAWRELPPVAVQGMVSFDAALRPETAVTAYAEVAVRVPKATRAAVRTGSTGAIKVWVNGRLAVDRDGYRPLRIDQDVGAAALEAGWNRVTVKLSAQESGGWSLFLRLTGPAGEPLPGLEVSADPARLAEASRKPAGRAGPVVDIAKDLKSYTKTADGWRDFGLYHRHVSPEDPEKHMGEEALAQAARLAPTPAAYLTLAESHADPNDQRKALEVGLERADKGAAAQKAPLLTMLGEIYHRARRERKAEELWLSAVAADPTWYPARLRLAELASERGLPAQAEAQLLALAQSVVPEPLKILRARADLALRRGQKARAEQLAEELVRAEADDTDALHQLYTFARARGALDQALAKLERVQALRPDLLSHAIDRAELLDGNGRAAEAHATLEAALVIAPEEPRLLERAGRLLHKLGREPEAQARLKQSLAFRPQNPELRAYLAELELRARPTEKPDPRADLQRAWGTDVRALITRYAGDTGVKKDTSGAPARVLHDAQVTRVHPNGLSETYQQRVIEILDERGARAEGDFDIRYTPDTQSVEVRAARIYRARPGTAEREVLEAVSIEEHDLSEPWYGLYYDVRGQVIRFSALQPGDVIDVEYIVSDVGRRNMFADYFGELHFFQEGLPRVESRYVLIAPKNKTLYFNQPRLAQPATMQRTDEVVGDERVYGFFAREIPKVDAEPGMPGFSEVAAYVHVSTYKTWDAVAAWYTGLVRSQLEPNAAITRAVREVTKGLKDERAKIRAIYDLVVKRTRYVGLEFGIHGYQPYRVSQVFARKFGDCKDKASLLVVMLKEAGIPASMVLARTRRGGDLDREPASLAPFDHAIAYVPKYDLYLDGTAEFSGADELPAQDQDIPVLQVSSGKLVRTPVLPSARNRVATTWTVALAASGAARVDERMSIAGEAAHDWRSHYQAPGERMDKYDHAWNGKHPGAKIEKLDMALEDLEKPVEVRAQVQVPHWARPEGEGAGETLVMQALGRDADMLRSYARLSARKFDLVLGYPWRQEERVVMTLPAGWKSRRLPDARTVESPFGKFILAVESKPGQVTVSATLEVTRHRVARADYAAFRTFCAQVDAAVSQELLLGRDAPRAANP